ncbi:MAG TPA: AsmA-like C-terminal region-containing protein [Acidobacteriaceae bacterium]
MSKEVEDRTKRERSGIPRWLVWLGATALVVFAALGIVAEYVAHHAEPILRRRVIASLQEHFHSRVELDELHISVMQGLQVSGNGLRIWPETAVDGVNPVLGVKTFEFRTSIRQLMEPTMRIGEVRLQGMQLRIPPKQERGPLIRHGKPRGMGRLKISVDKIVCSDVTLTIETSKPGKLPLEFDIRNLTLRNVGRGTPMPFEASLVNPKPVGDIHSTGNFGPWQSEEPRDTPVDGKFSFTNADLNTIKGLGGMLSSTGNYNGTLGEIQVAGTTDTPDFSLDVSEHPVDLKTEFNATVDGTTGDTKLNSVHATLLNTVLQVEGMVIRATGPQNSGHLIDLSVASDRARVEDVLRLGAKTSPPLMRGSLALRAHLTIPPGHVSVSRKLRIKGTFTIHGATLSNAKWQQTVDTLSARASGNPDQANATDAAKVESQIGGSFALADAMLDVPKLNYQMPGAEVALKGKYGLDGKTFDFDGTVRTDATASQMLTGWKSVVAMPFNKLLKKNGAGLEVPITISGTESAPKVGLNFGKLGSEILGRHKDEDKAPDPPHKP